MRDKRKREIQLLSNQKVLAVEAANCFVSFGLLGESDTVAAELLRYYLKSMRN